jgi:hypothetical protein
MLRKLKAVERLLLALEVGLHHVGGLALGLAGLVADRGLLALRPSTSASAVSRVPARVTGNATAV